MPPLERQRRSQLLFFYDIKMRNWSFAPCQARPGALLRDLTATGPPPEPSAAGPVGGEEEETELERKPRRRRGWSGGVSSDEKGWRNF